jgi:hypothetical protein
MRFHGFQIPIAISLIQLARTTNEPFQEFICYWSAFNNIYAVLADSKGINAKIVMKNGQTQFTNIHGIQMARVKPAKETEQIDLAFSQIKDDTKHCLLLHSATRFFVYRTPRWRERELKRDAKGQRLNGVLNVSRTINADYPIWSPIDTLLYEAYMSGTQTPGICGSLSKQLLEVLYTVRCNLVHGSKSAGDENDKEVVSQALALLKMIVASFQMPDEVEEDEEN